MTESKRIIYSHPKIEILFWFLGILSGIGLGIFAIYIIAITLPQKYRVGEFSEVIIILVIGLPSGFFLLYLGIQLFIDRWRDSYIIELYEDKVIGYSQFGNKKWELKWNEIVSFTMPKFGSWHCALNDIHGNKLRLSFYLAPFVECIETILSRIPNLQHSDLDKLKRERFWKMNSRAGCPTQEDLEKKVDMLNCKSRLMTKA